MKITTKLLLSPEDFSPSFKGWEIVGVLNPGAIRMSEGKIILYVRIAESATHKHGNIMKCPVMVSEKDYRVDYQHIKEEDIVKKGLWGEIYIKDGTCRLPNISHFRRVILNKDGFEIEKIEQKPAFTGIPGEGDYGVEDPRITEIENKYYMAYVGVSKNEGISTYLAVSEDLKKWRRLGIIFREQNKDVVLFPQKIKGRYVAFNRPETKFHFSRPGIWISYSKDLIYWGRDRNLIRPRGGNSWEDERLGSGAPPIKTKKGWLFIYHGVQDNNDSRIYSVGAVLLDLKNPEKIIARSPRNKPLFWPKEDYEKKGYVNDVVFPTGAIPTLDRRDLLIYSGGADKVVAVKKISLKEIFRHLRV